MTEPTAEHDHTEDELAHTWSLWLGTLAALRHWDHLEVDQKKELLDAELAAMGSYADTMLPLQIFSFVRSLGFDVTTPGQQSVQVEQAQESAGTGLYL